MKKLLIVCVANLLSLGLPTKIFAEMVGVFFDPAVEQIKFAAGDVKAALEKNEFTVEMLPAASLNASYPNKKVVVALASDTPVTTTLAAQGGGKAVGLGEQAYGLRTTDTPQKSHWALGGDANGAMYGGLQIAENIGFSQFTGTYADKACAMVADLNTLGSSEENPHIAQRTIKFNIRSI